LNGLYTHTGGRLRNLSLLKSPSFKEKCLDRLIPIGERHFRRAVTEYVEHYHEEWNHQGSTIVSSHARW
jgi:hypothetical protein